MQVNNENTFQDNVMQTLLTDSLQKGYSANEILQTVLESYKFQQQLEIDRAEQVVFDFIKEFDSLTELLINQLKEKFVNPNYAKIATEINKVVFGKHELGIRQMASQKDLKRLADFETLLANLLKDDFIKSENELMIYVNKKIQ
jgi:hypothetical protein